MDPFASKVRNASLLSEDAGKPYDSGTEDGKSSRVSSDWPVKGGCPCGLLRHLHHLQAFLNHLPTDESPHVILPPDCIPDIVQFNTSSVIDSLHDTLHHGK